MTRDEFKFQFKRLCEGFAYDPRIGQIEAFYERLQHCDSRDWRESVTTLLCAPRFPATLEVLRAEIDRHAESRRKATVHQQNREAHRWFQGRPVSRSDVETPEDRVYGDFRMGLMRLGMGTGGKSFAKIHADGLSAWLDKPDNVQWARSVPYGPCGCATAPHSLFVCLVEEAGRWAEKAKEA